ncbi:hypothetical protein LTR29_004906, partial [Friedmanniomyces endolithicus]
MHIGIVCPSKIKSSGNPSSEVIKRAKEFYNNLQLLNVAAKLNAVEARLRVATKTPKKKSKTTPPTKRSKGRKLAGVTKLRTPKGK